MHQVPGQHVSCNEGGVGGTEITWVKIHQKLIGLGPSIETDSEGSKSIQRRIESWDCFVVSSAKSFKRVLRGVPAGSVRRLPPFLDRFVVDRKVTFEAHYDRIENYHHLRHLMLNLLALERMVG
jgi:hypothetical protein